MSRLLKIHNNEIKILAITLNQHRTTYFYLYVYIFYNQLWWAKKNTTKQSRMKMNKVSKFIVFFSIKGHPFYEFYFYCPTSKCTYSTSGRFTFCMRSMNNKNKRQKHLQLDNIFFLHQNLWNHSVCKMHYRNWTVKM